MMSTLKLQPDLERELFVEEEIFRKMKKKNKTLFVSTRTVNKSKE